MLLMVSADTKDVEATGKVSYESETTVESTQAAEREAVHTAMLLENARAVEQQKAAPEEIENDEDAIEAAEAQDAAQVAEAIVVTAESEAPAEEDSAVEADSGWVYEVSEEDYDALLRLVEAEASGEDSKGKLLVANVVLNRMESSAFPNTIKEVIYQRSGGRAQFSPVATGKIDRVTVSEETVEAVNRALCGEDESEGALYFVAPAYADAENHSWFKRNLTLLFSYNGHEFYT